MASQQRSDAILARLSHLHPRKIDLSLERMMGLLARLGHPERRLPPVFHVAGTNGKGSTIAFMRACLEASGRKVHVYTSPHLVSFRERIRLAGRLVEEEPLSAALELCERLQDGRSITLFEITTAAAFHLFAATPADALLLEVGLGGRFDATNVIDAPAACVITPISYDHQEFLGSTLDAIGGEKAGVIKPGAALVVARQPPEALRPIEREALRARVSPLLQDRDFSMRQEHGRLVYEDGGRLLDLPVQRLLGRHQTQNAALAIAALRAVYPDFPARALERGLMEAEWPARMQNIVRGELVELAPRGAEIWLDGAHNEAGARAAAETMADFEDRSPRPLVIICGMLTTKQPEVFLSAFRGLTQEVLAVSFAAENARPASEVAAAARDVGLPAAALDDLDQALTFLAARSWAQPPRILIAGSLYLAGEALKRNGVELT